MTTTDPKNLRSRFYVSEIARWLLVVFFFLSLALFYFANAPSELSLDTFRWMTTLRSFSLVVGVLMLALGNFLRLGGSPLHRKLRYFWLLVAIVFAIFWWFRGTSFMAPQLA